MNISPLQHFFSFFYPIKTSSAVGKSTPILNLYRFQGRWQLGSETAIYSDGPLYRPLTSAFKYLKMELPSKANMLVLGGGLGSAVSILHKLGIQMSCTLVEIDQKIIDWGKEIIENETKYPCNWICDDVEHFVKGCNTQYELIIVDVFQDRLVPHFICSPIFLQQAHNLISNNKGVLVLNYIINNKENWEEALTNIQNTFRIEHIISIGINRILILRRSA